MDNFDNTKITKSFVFHFLLVFFYIYMHIKKVALNFFIILIPY